MQSVLYEIYKSKLDINKVFSPYLPTSPLYCMSAVRALIECFKYLAAKELLLSTEGTCQLWRTVANQAEVLYAILDAEGIDVTSRLFSQFPTVQVAFVEVLKRHKCLYTVQTRNIVGNYCKSVLLKVNTLSGKVTPEVTLDRHYSLLQLHCNLLFLCGGHNEVTCSSAAFLYDPGNKAMKRLPNMRIGRTNCSLVEHNDYIYVFGGSKGYENLTSADRLSLARAEWEALPDLPCPVYQYSPVSCGQEIFILAENPWRGVIVYSETEGKYSKRATLRPDFDMMETDLVTFCRGKQWFLVSKGTVLIIDLASPGLEQTTGTAPPFMPISGTIEGKDQALLLGKIEGKDAVLSLTSESTSIQCCIVASLSLRSCF